MPMKPHILELLAKGPMTDHELADAIDCPVASIRRARHELVENGEVVQSNDDVIDKQGHHHHRWQLKDWKPYTEGYSSRRDWKRMEADAADKKVIAEKHKKKNTGFDALYGKPGFQQDCEGPMMKAAAKLKDLPPVKDVPPEMASSAAVVSQAEFYADLEGDHAPMAISGRPKEDHRTPDEKTAEVAEERRRMRERKSQRVFTDRAFQPGSEVDKEARKAEIAERARQLQGGTKLF